MLIALLEAGELVVHKTNEVPVHGVSSLENKQTISILRSFQIVKRSMKKQCNVTGRWLGYKVEAGKTLLGIVAGEGFSELRHEGCHLWQRYSSQREWQRQSLRGENKCDIFRD